MKENPEVLVPGRLLREKQVLQYIPISRSSWWNGIRAGKYPQGRKLAEKTTVWKSDDIIRIIAEV